MDFLFVVYKMLVISFAVSGAKGEGSEAGRERKGLGFLVTSRADPSSQYAATTRRDRHRISVRKMERSYQEEGRGVEIIRRSLDRVLGEDFFFLFGVV
ncbi:unnamed protein product [Sphagnum jensenii]|uniref:Secreted protein n=1 Tax=Sphagnum jensenii TaxID=128206 RepID=A0ABP1AC53_9BRYO